jgi:DNA gyrase subunit B
MIREAENLLEMDKKFDHPDPGCFTGDVRIKLLNGTVRTFKELAEDTQTEFWVYASDGKGNVLPALAKNVRKTKVANFLTEITLDNGSTIRCTPDHRFMLRDGTYCQAQNLKAGTSLMPLYTKMYRIRYKCNRDGFYEQVHSNGNWRMTHKLVSTALGFGAGVGEVIHHIDINPLNNDPKNLEKLTVAEHNRRHMTISAALRRPDVIARRVATFKARYSNNPEFLAKKVITGKKTYRNLTKAQRTRLNDAAHTPEVREKTRQRNIENMRNPIYRRKVLAHLRAYATSITGRAKSAVTATKTNSNPKNWPAERVNRHVKSVQRAMRIKQHRDDESALHGIADYRPYLLGIYHAIKLSGGGGNYTWHRRLAGTDFKANAERLRGMSVEDMQRCTGLTCGSLSEYLRKLGKYDIIRFANHKVVSVKLVSACEDVYDMEVPGFENFGLEAGVFVHNSKDTTDSAAGSYINCVNSDEKLSMGSHNAPTVYTGQQVQQFEQQAPPITINLPDKGYTRTKVFHV